MTAGAVRRHGATVRSKMPIFTFLSPFLCRACVCPHCKMPLNPRLLQTSEMSVSVLTPLLVMTTTMMMRKRTMKRVLLLLLRCLYRWCFSNT